MRYFAEFVYAVVVKQLLGLYLGFNILLIVYDHNKYMLLLDLCLVDSVPIQENKTSVKQIYT